MLKKIILIVSICVLASYQGVFACGDGNKHMGKVTAVNEESKTFTIMDMELQKPITFSAADNILKEAAGSSSTVTVTYEEKDGELIALEIGS
jgi:hypothetical protein